MVRAFPEDDLDHNAPLLAERPRRHVEAEPLLPADPDFRGEVAALWRMDGAAGAVADGGYLLGYTRPESIWGPNVWIDTAGHAARDPELVRDLYAAAAGPWVEQG